ncbi:MULTISPECIES: hypothetical protein [unclassified Cetobacterium]|uniref:hypothetical protein n=1 Tax=unclassified Cetobacterium TaxID=2630983 RepID=UPI0012E0BF66|nr:MULTISPECIES: hypothetical protein [unclassified Cetobacterium]
MKILNQNTHLKEHELCEKIANELLPKLAKLDFELKSIKFEKSSDNLLKLKIIKA